MRSRFSIKATLLVVLVFVMINLPVVHSTWTSWRVERSGVDVAATVTDTDEQEASDGTPEYYVAFRFPEEIDPEKSVWAVQVDEPTYDAATRDETLPVRVLADRPAAYTVEGEVTHRLGLVITLVADFALLLMLLLLWAFRVRLRPPLEAVAVGDVERCPPGSALDKLEGGLYLVRGEVSAIEDGEIVLDLGDRSVRVVLDGHHNPVGHQQPAQVQARLIG